MHRAFCPTFGESRNACPPHRRLRSRAITLIEMTCGNDGGDGIMIDFRLVYSDYSYRRNANERKELLNTRKN